MAKRPSEDDLRKIYDETIEPLYRFVSRRCGNERALAEDVTQETWLRAVAVWQRDGLPNKPIGWLTTVARNLILNQQRKRESIPLDLLPPAETPTAPERDIPDILAETVDVAAMVAVALLRIPKEEARLLESFHYDGRRMSQLAQSYGVSERAIEGRLRRARERLRRELELLFKTEQGLI
ncbi:MAG TPA: sigma-70 family RNA polymerase sigma factor [Gemmatimonadaceae bacterium]